MLANAAHIEEATANNIPYIDVDGLKAFNKDKTKIKKWCKKYDVLLASDSVAKQVTKLLGNVLVKLGKFPVALAEGEKLLDKISEGGMDSLSKSELKQLETLRRRLRGE